ncbi:hypothetical protein F4Y43_15570 [Candidatus Poribacteria bacterium]|nr:hypothetical protein [Candidatus Poribacteria bacterium]
MPTYVNGRLKEEVTQEKILRELEKLNATSTDGVICVPMDGEDWKLKLGQEMKNAGFPVDMNKIFFKESLCPRSTSKANNSYTDTT